MNHSVFRCKAPWTSIAFQPTGVAPCCIYGLDHVESWNQPEHLFLDVRKDFLAGRIPPGCSKCEQSHRDFNQGYYQSFDRYETDFNKVSIQEINLRSNNFCNLSCRSCGPHFSSKWEEDFRGHIVIVKDTDVFSKLAKLDLWNLKTIVFAGGEPTIMPEHTYLLTHLIESGHILPEIRVSTNLHNLHYKDVDLVKLWQHFPNLYLQVSLDAINHRAANIRSGTDWQIVEKNLKTICQESLAFYVNITVSALNIWFLEETLDYFAENFQCQVRFNLASDPEVINISVIPQDYRSELLDMLNRCQDKGHQIGMIKEYFEKEDTSHLWPSFLIYNLLLDVRRKEKFISDLPIFDDLLQRWIKL